MARTIMIAEVEDAAAWERLFRSHRDLFHDILGPAGMDAVHFTTTEDNRAVLYSEPDDLDAYFQTLDSDEIKAAMEADGVNRDSVQVFVLDKELAF